VNSRRKQIDALKNQAKIVILPIAPMLLKKIREAETVILQEAVVDISYRKNSEAQASSQRSHKSISSLESKKDAKDNSTRSKKSIKNGVSASKDQLVQEQKEDEVLKVEDSSNKIEEQSINNTHKNEHKENDEVLDEDEKLVLRPLRMKESEIKGFLEHYQKKISKQLLESYSPFSELLETSFSGYEPYWLCLIDKDKFSIKGLAVFHLDPESKIRSRVMILHASVTVEENLNDFLKELINFIWANVNCEEIRVGIVHIEQDNTKSAPYLPLKTAYQNLSFKWKTLANDENGKRVLILGLNRPITEQFLNPRYIL